MVYRYVNVRHPLGQLRDEMDRVLSGFFGRLPSGTSAAGSRGRPAVNLWETPQAVLAEMEVPGVNSEQIELAVVGEELSLSVRREDVAEEGVAYHRRERGVGKSTRLLRLPVEVDAEKVQAELRNGVLTITLPKAEGAKPRKIQVVSE